MLNIDELLKEAMKNKDNVRLEVIRSIKAEFAKREHNGEEMTERHQLEVLAKMVAQRQDSINQFKQANRMDLVEKETNELNVLKEFAPKELTKKEVEELTLQIIAEHLLLNGNDYKLSMKDIKPICTKVKEIHPSVNAGWIAEIVKSQI